ncbi:MAG: hypothetical protein LC744_04760 [Chloroflexi bacterium]|nr:hypothetical protein [Chloroflexota bacterium]
MTHLAALGAPCWFDVTVTDVDRAAYQYHGAWLHGKAIGAIAEVCAVEPFGARFGVMAS